MKNSVEEWEDDLQNISQKVEQNKADKEINKKRWDKIRGPTSNEYKF